MPDDHDRSPDASRDGDAVMLFCDVGGAAYLRPDGVIVVESWDDDALPRVVTDPKQRFAAIVLGSQIRPELRRLLPPRPPHAEDCPACSGSGLLDHGGIRLTCGDCGALGWWPPA